MGCGTAHSAGRPANLSTHGIKELKECLAASGYSPVNHQEMSSFRPPLELILGPCDFFGAEALVADRVAA